MKRPIKHLTVVPLMVGVLAIAANTASGQSRDERAIRAAGQAWQRWIKEQRSDSLATLFTPDAMVLLGNTAPVRGAAAVGPMWADYTKIPGLSVSWTPQKIDVTSPTRATEVGTYAESYDTPNGKVSDAGTYVTLWNKVNGKWRVALDAPISSMPATPTAPPEGTNFIAQSGSALTWNDFPSPGFPPGAKVSVLSGDPSKPGQFALRLSFPDGYMVPLHWHPTAEIVTVISGAGQFGMGNTVDMSAAHAFTAGDYVFIPARHAHFLQTRGATVLQVNGNGPFQINLGAPR
jgi:ketosteroid isomerase-like protein/quercetin dioxygenase-like cupin family protein